MRVHCCNPTCAAVLRNSAGDPFEVNVLIYPEMLEAFGWSSTRVDGKLAPICPRCLRDE